MSLKSAMKKAAKTGMKIAGDVALECQYQSIDDNGIDEKTVNTVTTRFLFKMFSFNKGTENVEKGEVVAIVEVDKFGGIIPKAGDVLVKPSGEELTVIDYTVDPADALFQISLKRP